MGSASPAPNSSIGSNHARRRELNRSSRHPRSIIAMQDQDPNDPLWKLLGQARRVEPRGDFVSKVLRTARNTPQERGLWAALRGWWQDAAPSTSRAWQSPALLGAAAAIALAAVAWQQSAVPSGGIAQGPVIPEAVTAADAIDLDPIKIAQLAEDLATPLASLDHLDALLANADTSTLSDRDIVYLLY